MRIATNPNHCLASGKSGSMGDMSVIADLPEVLKMAREYALLGNYETALTHFDHASSSIGKYVRSVEDATERQRFNKVRDAALKQAERRLVDHEGLLLLTSTVIM